jgi:hypothetical protein
MLSCLFLVMPGLLMFLLALSVPVTQCVEADPCKEYETAMQGFWKRSGVTELYKQVWNLEQEVEDLYNKLDKDPTNPELWGELLCRYNYWRKRSGFPTVSSVQELSLEKIKDELQQSAQRTKESQKRFYQEWKERQLAASAADKQTLPALLASLSSKVSIGFMLSGWETNPYAVLYPYNLLRELLGQPHASSVQEIDKNWLEEVKSEIGIAALIERGYGKPTLAQKKFIEDEIARLQFQTPIVPLIHPVEKAGEVGLVGGKPFLAVCKDLDIDTRLNVLYHELGHIQHKDGVNRDAILQGTKTIADLAAEHDFVSDIKDIERYLQLGWEAIPSLQQTRLGEHLYKIMHYDDPGAKMNQEKLLEQHHALWEPPTNAKGREAVAYYRGQERRADLYMLRQLYEQGRLGPILTFLWDYGMTGTMFSRAQPWVISSAYQDIQPSDVERSLYALGFLIAQGVDVPNVLYEWETKGTCPPLEEELPAGQALPKAESSSVV